MTARQSQPETNCVEKSKKFSWANVWAFWASALPQEVHKEASATKKA